MLTREEAELAGWTFDLDERRGVATHAARELRTVSYDENALAYLLGVVSAVEEAEPSGDVIAAAELEEKHRTVEDLIRARLADLFVEIDALSRKVADGTVTAGERVRLSYVTARADVLLIRISLRMLDDAVEERP